MILDSQPANLLTAKKGSWCMCVVPCTQKISCEGNVDDQANLLEWKFVEGLMNRHFRNSFEALLLSDQYFETY